MKRSLLIVATVVATAIIILALLPSIFTEQLEGGKLTSWRYGAPVRK